MSHWDVCVVGGCGHVGLPLSIAFASANRRVAVYDINREAVRKVQQGKMPFMEKGAQPLLRSALRAGTLHVSEDKSVIRRSRALVIVIGTPVDEHMSPNLLMVRNALDDILTELRDGQLLILRSTVYPGTTQMVDRFLRSHGRRLDVAFCPERVAEGNALKEYRELPQIVSGASARSLRRARALFSCISKHLVETTVSEAELAKLFTNAWRYIRFAAANQFFTLANDCGVDFFKVHEAMTHLYPRARDFALPGFAAGPCLLKDTMQLAAFSGHHFFLGHSAMLVNEGLPDYVVRKLKEKTDLSRKTVGILGMAFKAENDDLRDSLSVKLKKLLDYECRRVLCSDEYIRDPTYVAAEKLVASCDVVIVAAPHARYKTLRRRDALWVDVWNLSGRGGVLL